MKDFSGGSAVKNLPANPGDAGSILGLRRSPGEGNSNPLQYSCLGNHMDRGAWWVTVHGVREDLVTKQQHGSRQRLTYKEQMTDFTEAELKDMHQGSKKKGYKVK